MANDKVKRICSDVSVDKTHLMTDILLTRLDTTFLPLLQLLLLVSGRPRISNGRLREVAVVKKGFKHSWRGFLFFSAQFDP